MIGHTVSHYKILSKLGEGGMGIVYKAQDTKLDRYVALKFLPAHLSASEEDKTRFLQEAKGASALNHPNVCTIYEQAEENGQQYIVMELIEGESLKSKVHREKELNTHLSVRSVIDYGWQTAQGLTKAHEKGIIHRDIKSDNIMVTNDGLIKIMDFGLVKLKGSVNITRAGSTIGTAAYMSPEQVRGEDIDDHADIWAYGVVLFELLTGELPFRGEHESAMMYSITNEDPKDITKFRDDVPVQFLQIIKRCLEKDRTKRYSSMNEILQDISKLKSGDGIRIESLSITSIMNRLKRPVVALPILVVILGFGYLSYWFIERTAKVRWVQEHALPEIERLTGESKWTAAYLLAMQIENYTVDDPTFSKLRPLFSVPGVVKTDPPGADVFIAEYGVDPENWVFLGKTPSDTMSLPRGLWRMKISKSGYTTIDGAGFVGLVNKTIYKLDTVGSIPIDMVRVPSGKYGLNMPGLDHIALVQIGDFFIDKFEVTNKDYKEFLDQGGYQKKAYWKHPILKNGLVLVWEAAIKEFVDATGRTGPATWELGTYPEGRSDHPVGGISWYEAAAYAEFCGKSLPSVYHWNIAAETRMSSFIIPSSNFANKGTAAVGTYHGVSPFGTNDMGGNVREWCMNEYGKQRCILGGGWNDQSYMFTDFYAQPPFDRSLTNGMRCIKIQDPVKNISAAYASIEIPHRDFLKEKPIPDAIYKIYLSLYQYDRTSLNANIESSDTTEDWVMQKVTFDAAYGGERMIAYLFLPKTGKPPYQSVVYFPGSNAIFDRSSKSLQFSIIDFMVKSGRVVVYPIYKGTYERGSGLISDYPSETSLYREHVIAWAKDIGRSIDYLETRPDFDREKIAYFGVSWGGAMGAIMPAVEKRIKVSVLYVAGLLFQPAFPEVEALNFISHIKIPVIMLNGKYDHFFPVETSQKPMFALFGTPPQHKKYVLFETGHFVPRNQLIKESLDWLDKYLGPVKQIERL